MIVTAPGVTAMLGGRPSDAMVLGLLLTRPNSCFVLVSLRTGARDAAVQALA